jgi:4-amino-4-deoxy-L-arabinose transferase-like glycosyltransferase
MKRKWTLKNISQRRRRALGVLLILFLSFATRALMAQFIGARLTDAGWFPYGIYAVFDRQAQAVLDGTASAFWIDDPSRTDAAVYPPGYSLWLALIYSISGSRSVGVVQQVQWVMDALSALLVLGIGVTAYGWRAGFCAGVLVALSPLLATYGAVPLADAPTSWLILGGVWMLLLAARDKSWRWALGAGLLVGASCWLRANALLLAAWWAIALVLLVRAGWREKTRLGLALALGATLSIAPVMIRNFVAFRAFVPTGMGLGTNLWEGIGETERGRKEFGAVYGDEVLLEQERKELNPAPGAPFNLYYPNGVERDRARTRKSLAVIIRHPFWYTGVVAQRVAGQLKYAGEPSPIYGSTGVNVTSRKCLPPEWQGGALALIVNALGMLQSVLRYLLLPLILIGVFISFRLERRASALILTTVLYYLVFGSLMHMHIRYGLAMQALLLLFAGAAINHLAKLAVSYKQSARKP